MGNAALVRHLLDLVEDRSLTSFAERHDDVKMELVFKAELRRRKPSSKPVGLGQAVGASATETNSATDGPAGATGSTASGKSISGGRRPAIGHTAVGAAANSGSSAFHQPNAGTAGQVTQGTMHQTEAVPQPPQPGTGNYAHSKQVAHSYPTAGGYSAQTGIMGMQSSQPTVAQQQQRQQLQHQVHQPHQQQHHQHHRQQDTAFIRQQQFAQQLAQQQEMQQQQQQQQQQQWPVHAGQSAQQAPRRE